MPSEICTNLLRLISDERFVEFESFTERPNLFRIVGRTHTETWHSMFLGWLLDPQGSHGLGDFALRRLLLAVTNPDIKATKDYDPDLIARIASLGQLTNASVIPNERYQKELRGHGNRFDVFVENIKYDDKSCVLLIEQKYNSKITKRQCERYADWLHEKYKGSVRILLMPCLLHRKKQWVIRDGMPSAIKHFMTLFLRLRFVPRRLETQPPHFSDIT